MTRARPAKIIAPAGKRLPDGKAVAPALPRLDAALETLLGMELDDRLRMVPKPSSDHNEG